MNMVIVKITFHFDRKSGIFFFTTVGGARAPGGCQGAVAAAAGTGGEPWGAAAGALAHASGSGVGLRCGDNYTAEDPAGRLTGLSS